MYWILFVVLSNSLSEKQTIISDITSDIFNDTRVSGSIIDNDTEEHGSGITVDMGCVIHEVCNTWGV